MLRVQGCFSLFFVLICDTHRNGKKNVSQERPTAADPDGTGLDGWRKNANGVTTQPKFTHTDRFGVGITTAVAGVVVWPGVGAG